jgi:hypothetical protein
MNALRSGATGAAILYVVAEFARYYARMQEFCAWWTVACMRDDCWVSGSRFFIGGWLRPFRSTSSWPRCHFLSCLAFRKALRIGRLSQTDSDNCAQIS